MCFVETLRLCKSVCCSACRVCLDKQKKVVVVDFFGGGGIDIFVCVEEREGGLFGDGGVWGAIIVMVTSVMVKSRRTALILG